MLLFRSHTTLLDKESRQWKPTNAYGFFKINSWNANPGFGGFAGDGRLH